MAAIDFNTIIEKANPYHDERGRFASKPGGSASKWTPAKAIAEYQNHAYQAINEGLRAGKVEGDVKDLVAAMDKGFEEATPTKWSQTVHRADGAATTAEIWEKNGTTAKLPKKGDLADLWMDGEVRQAIKDSLVGETFTDKGYMSTSKDREKAQEFSTGNSYSPYGVDAMVHISVPKGSKVIDLGDDGFIYGSGEQEVILNRGSSYKIKAVEFNWATNGLDIYADYVTDVQKALTFEEILKFNPYHDSLGRFATANGATSMTYAPGKSKAHDNAIAREKEKQQETAAAGGKEAKYTEKERVAAVKGFTISDYYSIRKIQSGKTPSYLDEDELQEYTKKGEAIEEYISVHGPYKGEIYRGINTSGDEGFKVGQKIDMQGTSSWTTDEKLGYEWAGKNSNGDKGAFNHKTGNERAYVFKMQSPKKSAYIDDISENQGEKEVLVSTDTRFKITKIETSTVRTVITLEEA